MVHAERFIYGFCISFFIIVVATTLYILQVEGILGPLILFLVMCYGVGLIYEFIYYYVTGKYNKVVDKKKKVI